MKFAAIDSDSAIWPHLIKHKRKFLVLAGFGLCIHLLMLSPSLYMMQVYDRVLNSRNETTLLLLTLLVALLYWINSLLEMFRSMTLVRMSETFDADLSERVFSASFERNLNNGAVNPSFALADLNNLRQFLTGSALITFLDIPWIPVYLIVLWLIDPSLAWLCIVGGVVLFGLAWLNEKMTHAHLSEANQQQQQAAQYANTNLRNAEVIEAMGMLPALQSRWQSFQHAAIQHQIKASNKSALISALTRFIRLFLQSLTLCLGAYLVLEGKATGGVMIAASVLVGRALAPIEQAIASWKSWLTAREAYERLDTLLKRHPAREPGMPLGRPKGALQLDGVFVAPPNSQTSILKNIGFQLQAGEVLAVIGPSGSGKTILAKIMAGIWPCQQGKVRLDGADVYAWNKAELGQFIGYLPQDIELFAGSISENISRFGEVEPEAVIAAARMAGVHELILRLPRGYDTVIGEAGGNLSGGQRQRVALARALYRLPSLIILDEPNSNLDDEGERALLQAVSHTKQQGCTVVLITHRPASLSVADKTLLVKDGQLQLFGPTDKVMAKLGELNARTA
ncbi:type I secretion system permease/ATPase [Chitinibacter sp. S2-10]|uniref:type I secretion system permease/ATPase n=1 Tax=Chitinibacter sp. S2-10 TaxID=3373597 RepID=UPI00397755BF